MHDDDRWPGRRVCACRRHEFLFGQSSWLLVGHVVVRSCCGRNRARKGEEEGSGGGVPMTAAGCCAVAF